MESGASPGDAHSTAEGVGQAAGPGPDELPHRRFLAWPLLSYILTTYGPKTMGDLKKVCTKLVPDITPGDVKLALLVGSDKKDGRYVEYKSGSRKLYRVNKGHEMTRQQLVAKAPQLASLSIVVHPIPLEQAMAQRNVKKRVSVGKTEAAKTSLLAGSYFCEKCHANWIRGGPYRGQGRNKGKVSPRFRHRTPVPPGCPRWIGLKELLNGKSFPDDFKLAHEALKLSYADIGENHGFTATTAYNRVMKALERVPDGITLSKELTREVLRGDLFAVDKTYFGHYPHETVYIEGADIRSHEPLNYRVAKCGVKNSQSPSSEELVAVQECLSDISHSLKYKPEFAVLDLEPSLIEQVRRTWRGIKIIGDFFHLVYNLDRKDLPTKLLEIQTRHLLKIHGSPRLLKFKNSRLVLRRAVQEKIVEIARAETEQDRPKLVQELMAFKGSAPSAAENDRISRTINKFLRYLEKGYYPPMDELRALGLTSAQVNWSPALPKREEAALGSYARKLVTGPSDDLLEEHMRDLNDLYDRHHGYRKVSNFQKMVDLYWYEKRKRVVVGNDPKEYRLRGRPCYKCEQKMHEHCEFRAEPYWSAVHGCCCGGLMAMDPEMAGRTFGLPDNDSLNFPSSP
jgi:hypothetical protein